MDVCPRPFKGFVLCATGIDDKVSSWAILSSCPLCCGGGCKRPKDILLAPLPAFTRTGRSRMASSGSAGWYGSLWMRGGIWPHSAR